MHVAQFIQRYPPALGGSEAYTARLCEYLAARGDSVTVWTSDAVELSEMWAGRRPTPPPPSLKGRGGACLSPCGNGARVRPPGEGGGTTDGGAQAEGFEGPLTRLEHCHPLPPGEPG